MTMPGETTLAELLSQPEAWARLIARLEAGDLRLGVDPASFADILLFGSGSSYYLAQAVADWMRRRGMPARAVPSCEILLDTIASEPVARPALAIGFSRSGRSSEVLLAAERASQAGFEVAAVSCTEGSPQLVAADHPLLVAEGHEDGLVMLRSFTAMLLAMQWITGRPDDRRALASLPKAGQTLIEGHDRALRAFARSRDFNRFVYLASGSSFPLAREAALKAQEMAIATTEAYHSLEYRHGPKACADARTMICLFALSDFDHGLALARDCKALGAALMVIGGDADRYADVADLVVALPGDLDEAQGAVLEMLAPQLFAHETALRLGSNPDAPQNLAKVVTF